MQSHPFSTSAANDNVPEPTAEQHQLVADNIPLVKALAYKMGFFRQIAREDLESVGFCALVSSARSFNSSFGVAFSSYAYHRIRGAMLHAIRDGHGCLSRSEASVGGFERLVLDGVDPANCQALQDDVAHNPEEACALRSLRERVQKAIQTLRARDRQVVEALYYRHDGSFQAAATEIGVGRPHVFRTHARALQKLRRLLSDVAAQ